MSVHTTSRALRRRLALGSLLPVLALTAACGGDDERHRRLERLGVLGVLGVLVESSDQPYDAETDHPRDGGRRSATRPPRGSRWSSPARPS